MLAFVLIVTMMGQQKFVGEFENQSGCEKTAIEMVEKAQSKSQKMKASCYKIVSTASWN